MVRQETSVESFNGLEVGIAGPRAIQFTLRFASGASLPVRLSSEEARAFADALTYWAEMSEHSALGASPRAQPPGARAAAPGGKRLWSGRAPTPAPSRDK